MTTQEAEIGHKLNFYAEYEGEPFIVTTTTGKKVWGALKRNKRVNPLCHRQDALTLNIDKIKAFLKIW